MSLINDMLQELDARGATPALPKAVQITAPPYQRKRRKTSLIALVVISLAMLLYLLHWLWLTIQSAQPALPIANTPTPPVAIQTTPAPTAKLAEPVLLEQTPLISLANLKMDVMLSKPPELSAPVVENKSTSISTSSKATEPEHAKELKETKETKPAPAPVPAPSSMHISPAANSPQQRAENEYRKANQALQQGRHSEALLALEQALILDAQHHAARQTMVATLIQLNRLDEAIKRLQQGLQIDPKQTVFASMLARLQAERGDVPAAIETMYTSLPLAGNQAEFEALLAALLQRDKRHKQAVDHYQAALKLQPENGVWWMGMAISLQAENRLAASMDAFLKAKNSATLNPQLLAFVEQRLAQLQSANK